jgi:hypothetical protein
MILNNLFDYSNQNDPKGFKFWIPDSDPAIPFPYEVDGDGVIVDKNGEPAIFAVWMLDSLNWDLWTEATNGAVLERNVQKVQDGSTPMPTQGKGN